MSYETKTGVLTVREDGGFGLVLDHSITLVPGQQYDVTLRLRPDLGALRRLRLHHWRQVCKLADTLSTGRGTPAGRAEWQAKHAEHLGAVQALNDLFPIGDTAERDAATMG